MKTRSDISEIKLTQYSHGAGCGCKISPAALKLILGENDSGISFPGLLVGNSESDDAAVLDLGDGTAIISTTDFFMPIVDEPEDFGRIASVNAISDVYAMGGTPILAIAILGWPINTLAPEIAQMVIAGSKLACAEAGIPLAGGHSIDSPEPIFGLAVTGRVSIENLKKNGGATPGCILYLTKPLGVGILSTAQKNGKLKPEHAQLAINSMLKLNSIGVAFGRIPGVKAMTDVTGFGLLGHLLEMCDSSGVSALLEYEQIPLLEQEPLHYYLAEKCIPGGTGRNWESYGHKVSSLTSEQKAILCDPQTSGGLLIAVDPSAKNEFLQVAGNAGLELLPIGNIVLLQKKRVIVK